MRRLALLLVACLSAGVAAESGERPRDPQICGSFYIRGEEIPAIRTRTRGCGIANPVRVTEIHGVRLEPAATMSCKTARALRKWVYWTAKPKLRARGGLEALNVYDSYSCRPRNNVPGAKLSVHGKGQAIDIGAFRLKDGSTLSVIDDWRDRRDGKILRALHDGACGPFQTVLGPAYNAAHRNHFHFDLERNGKFCI